MLEALTGQIFLATLVARLVARVPGTRERRADPPVRGPRAPPAAAGPPDAWTPTWEVPVGTSHAPPRPAALTTPFVAARRESGV